MVGGESIATALPLTPSPLPAVTAAALLELPDTEPAKKRHTP